MELRVSVEFHHMAGKGLQKMSKEAQSVRHTWISGQSPKGRDWKEKKRKLNCTCLSWD